MASHQLSTNAAHADVASADAIVATPADDAAPADAAPADAIEAAKTGDLAALAAASDQNLRAVDAYGSNALHWAAGRGHLALVRHLVEDRGMDASFPANPPRRRDAPTTRGRTALHYAARNGHLDVVEYLVGRPDVDADARAEGGVSPAQLACWRNEFAVVERLVAAGVDAAQKNDAGCGLAHWLACAPRDAGDLQPLAAWLAARLGPAALAVEPNGHGHTCLHKAAFAGHSDLSSASRRVDGVLTVYVFVASKAYRWGRVRLDAVASTPSTDGTRPSQRRRRATSRERATRHAIDAIHARSLGADDAVLDATGGRASDDADAAGHAELRDFLRRHADRAKDKASRAALGLPAAGALDAVHVRDAFREKALATHPDRAVNGDAAFVEARAARDYLSGVVDEDARVTRRLPLLIEALGPAPGEARAHVFAARVVAAILEHGDGGVALAHLPKKFRLLWGCEFGEAAAAAGFPQRGVKRVLWRLKYAVRISKGEPPMAFSRVSCSEVRARLEA